MVSESYSGMRLVPGFHIHEMNRGRIVLLSEGDKYCIQDPIGIEIIKYLKDKEKLVSIEEIQTRLQDLKISIPPDRLQKTMEELFKISVVTSQESILPYDIQAFLFKLGIQPQAAEDRLKLSKVAISSFSRCPAQELEKILHDLGIHTGQQDATLHVLIVDDYLDTRVQNFSQLAQQSNLPWILVKPHGRSLWIGPLFRPDQPSQASYESLVLRLKENRSFEIDALGTASEHFNLPSLIALPNTRAIGLNIIATEILKWIVSGTSGLISNILTFDSVDLSIAFHYVDFHPLAKTSEISDTPSVKLSLNSSIKTFFDIEGARTRSPDETWKYMEHLISPITGLISKIYYKQENNYHIYYGPRSLHATDNLQIGHIRSPEIVVGKSTSNVKAQVGCVAEAIERYHCANSQLHRQYNFTYEEIANEAIHPQVLLNFSPLQYANREITNSKLGPYQWVPLPFDETKKIHWLRLASLNSSKENYFPSTYCYMHGQDRQEQMMCPGNSNGCACGNSLEEALFYGISEIIERDAFAIWWYNRLIRPTVDLDSFSNHSIRTIANRIKSQGRCLRVIDITSDIEVPAFAAVSWKIDGSRIIFGASANLDPEVGIVGALGELHQGLTRADVSSDIDITTIVPAERDLVRWLIHEKVEQHPFIWQEKGKKNSGDYPKINNNDFLEDLHVYFKHLQARSLDVFALNLTSLNSPMTVVKVIVPTMRHFWARYGEGRLYQVPVSLGDRTVPLKENELNPIPYFL